MNTNSRIRRKIALICTLFLAVALGVFGGWWFFTQSSFVESNTKEQVGKRKREPELMEKDEELEEHLPACELIASETGWLHLQSKIFLRKKEVFIDRDGSYACLITLESQYEKKRVTFIFRSSEPKFSKHEDDIDVVVEGDEIEFGRQWEKGHVRIMRVQKESR